MLYLQYIRVESFIGETASGDVCSPNITSPPPPPPVVCRWCRTESLHGEPAGQLCLPRIPAGCRQAAGLHGHTFMEARIFPGGDYSRCWMTSGSGRVGSLMT